MKPPMPTASRLPRQNSQNQNSRRQAASRKARSAGRETHNSRPARLSRLHPRILLLALLVLLALGLGAWNLQQSSWFQERRLSRMSLAELQREGGRHLDDPRMLYYIGLRLNQQGRYMEADPYLRNAVGLDPDSPRLRDAWMQALLGSGLVTAAFGQTREFAGTHPNSAEAHLILGKFYASQNSMIKASEEASHAVMLDPSLGEAWSLLAMTKSNLGWNTDAEAAAERAVALRPGNSTDRLGLALLQARQGQTEKARTTFARAAALAPNSAIIRGEYARFLLTTAATPDDLRTAVSEARQAFRLAPNDAEAALTLGQALTAQGQDSEAIPLLEAAAALAPLDPAPALALSQTYYRQKDAGMQSRWQKDYQKRQQHAALKQELITAIMKDPNAPRPHQAMAVLLAEEGDVTGCLRHQSKALRCPPDAPPAQAAAAQNLAAAGHAAEALPLARRAVDLAPVNPKAREAMGDVLLALGQSQKAKDSYDRAAVGLPERAALYNQRLARASRLAKPKETP